MLLLVRTNSSVCSDNSKSRLALKNSKVLQKHQDVYISTKANKLVKNSERNGQKLSVKLYLKLYNTH